METIAVRYVIHSNKFGHEKTGVLKHCVHKNLKVVWGPCVFQRPCVFCAVFIVSTNIVSFIIFLKKNYHILIFRFNFFGTRNWELFFSLLFLLLILMKILLNFHITKLKDKTWLGTLVVSLFHTNNRQ